MTEERDREREVNAFLRVELEFYFFVCFFHSLLHPFSFTLSVCLCRSPSAMRRRAWTAAAASWKRMSQKSSSSGTNSCLTMQTPSISTSSISITTDLNRSTSLLLAPSSALAIHSRSFGGVPEGAQVFDR